MPLHLVEAKTGLVIRKVAINAELEVSVLNARGERLSAPQISLTSEDASVASIKRQDDRLLIEARGLGAVTLNLNGQPYQLQVVQSKGIALEWALPLRDVFWVDVEAVSFVVSHLDEADERSKTPVWGQAVKLSDADFDSTPSPLTRTLDYPVLELSTRDETHALNLLGEDNSPERFEVQRLAKVISEKNGDELELLLRNSATLRTVQLDEGVWAAYAHWSVADKPLLGIVWDSVELSSTCRQLTTTPVLSRYIFEPSLIYLRPSLPSEPVYPCAVKLQATYKSAVLELSEVLIE